MRFILLLTILCLAAASANAQDTSALINKALDEQVNLKLNNTLPDAMDVIRQKFGIRIEAAPAVWDMLPWGRDTNVTATIENITLREALTLIMRKLGLTLALRDVSLEIQPMPALKRLAQRSTVVELRALDYLASTRMNLNLERPTIKRLLEAVDEKLAAVKDPEMAVEDRLGDGIDRNRTVFVPRNATLMDALESLPKDTPATWYPWGKSIIITSKQDRIRALLDKPVTIPTGDDGRELIDVLNEISTRTGVAFDYEPGLVQALPANVRIIRGVIENAPARQVLSKISASTGINYAILDDQVAIAAKAPATETAPATAPRDPTIGIIQLDSGIQVLVPTSQVPPDMREYLKVRTQRELKKIREMMEDENFKPTPPPPPPAPATQPSHDQDL
jgi:hypothetical protein